MIPTLKKITKTNRTPQHIGLNTQVKKYLDHYLKQMGNELPSDLYQMVIDEVEVPLIETAMEYAEGNQTLAAKILGISRITLRKKLSLHNIS